MSGVIFVVCIPTSNYEYLLKYGKPRELITIDSAPKCKLEVELRNKKAKSIPIHLTQRCYSDLYEQKLEKISEIDDLITMENVCNQYLNNNINKLKHNQYFIMKYYIYKRFFKLRSTYCRLLLIL